jgi:hypothetical protein
LSKTLIKTGRTMKPFRHRLTLAGIAVTVAGLVTAVPATMRAAFAAPVAGHVVAFGEDDAGQIDPPSGLATATAVAAGAYHSLALRSDGTVVGWGNNDFGQATAPAGLANVVAVAAGSYFSLALRSGGTVAAWGGDDPRETDVPADATGVTAIAAGDRHSLAVKSNGTVEGWGDDSAGETDIPSGLNNVISVAAGKDFSLALKSDGTVVAWGDPNAGETDVPAGLTGVVAISAGWQHAIALKSDGTVVGWGANGSGQATPPAGLNNVTAISAGYFHDLALEADGTVVAWGNDGFGEAAPPPGLVSVHAIAAGGFHSLTVTTGTGPISVSVTPSAPGLNIGGTVQLSATAKSADGSTQTVTNASKWISSNPAVATVSTSGLVTGVAGGQATMSATSSGLTGKALITVAAATTTVQENALTVSYGTWSGVRDNFASGTSYRQSSAAGAVMTFHFTGTALTLVTRTGPNQGIATVSIGGKVRGRFDLYSPSLQEQAPKKISGLAKGGHTLTLTVTGQHNPASTGNTVAVDAFKVGGTTTEDTARGLTWSGWSGVAAPKANGGGYREAATTGAVASFSFTGTGVDVAFAKGPAFGKMQVAIDGTAQPSVDLYKARPIQWNVAVHYGGLPAGPHTVTVTVLGTKNTASSGTTVPLDAFIVYS